MSVNNAADSAQTILGDLDQPVLAVRRDGEVTLAHDASSRDEVLAVVDAMATSALGDASFVRDHGLVDAYMAGAMANGIASEAMVRALATSGRLASFGAAGLIHERLDRALRDLSRDVAADRLCCNLIHAPMEQQLERDAVDLFLSHGVRLIEASAYLNLTTHLVRYRAAGLSRASDGRVLIGNRIVAKVSRAETAAKFLAPAPDALVQELLAQAAITVEQAELVKMVPMADDITVEGDSGGHTDRRPLHALLPVIQRQRDTTPLPAGVRTRVRVGAAGGLGTPGAVLAAFMAGADYVVTGSVNQGCVESGASDRTKRLLAEATVTDCEMAPAADMFEMGVDLQVLRRGTMFPMRARRLREVYKACNGIEDIPADDREHLEKSIFRTSLEAIWSECEAYFSQRDPAQLDVANRDPKAKMALVFRWYLGMSSRWSNIGDEQRALDYQIWCGPAMGAFNDWTHGTYLADPANRHVADVAAHLMRGAAYEFRVRQLVATGVRLPAALTRYVPQHRLVVS